MLPRSQSTTRGQVLRKLDDNLLVFKPTGTTYELHLRSDPPYQGPLNEPVDGLIRAQARKVYTVPSGGNFIAPIFGPPRTIQGRVKFADAKEMLVQAGPLVVVELPAGDSAIDLNNGLLGEGSLVNVTAMPGASIEFAPYLIESLASSATSSA